MTIDPGLAIGATFPDVHTSWTTRDVLLYHLSIGAGSVAPGDPHELRYTFEGDLVVLPTFAAVPVYQVAGDINSLPGVDVDLTMILHGEQQIEAHRALPAEAEVVGTGRIADVYDKGKAAVIVIETEFVTLDGEPLVTSRSLAFARGEGGFGGDPGPRSVGAAPEHEPDVVVNARTSPNQALLFRLNGDWNPLHADPSFAQVAGFDRPIMHGQCVYAMALRALVDEAFGGDPTCVALYTARFAGSMFPGETLVTEAWRTDDGLVVRATTAERGEPVLSNGLIVTR